VLNEKEKALPGNVLEYGRRKTCIKKILGKVAVRGRFLLAEKRKEGNRLDGKATDAGRGGILLGQKREALFESDNDGGIGVHP